MLIAPQDSEIPSDTNTLGYQIAINKKNKLENTQPWKRYSQKMIYPANAER